MQSSPILLSIEGNIGSGKSTLLRQLRARHPDWHFIDEPVDSWMSMRDEHGKSLLELFYGDKNRWGYTFQNTALLTRILNTRAAVKAWEAAGRPGKPIFITERCVGTDHHVFAETLYKDGELSLFEFDLYKKWYHAFADDVLQPAAYIHVDTPVTICDERIHKRCREGEARIPLEYLDRLDSAHFAWLRAEGFQPPVLRVDNVSAEPTTVEEIESWVERQWLGAMD